MFVEGSPGMLRFIALPPPLFDLVRQKFSLDIIHTILHLHTPIYIPLLFIHHLLPPHPSLFLYFNPALSFIALTYSLHTYCINTINTTCLLCYNRIPFYHTIMPASIYTATVLPFHCNALFLPSHTNLFLHSVLCAITFPI